MKFPGEAYVNDNTQEFGRIFSSIVTYELINNY